MNSALAAFKGGGWRSLVTLSKAAVQKCHGNSVLSSRGVETNIF